MTASEQWVLQICHGYDGPFLDCVRQYAALFEGTSYKVCTVYLTGTPDEEVVRQSGSEEVFFLGYSSREVRGLKVKAIRDLRRLADCRAFRFCIAHRFKPVYIALLGTRLPVIGVHHAFGDYERPMRRMFANFFRKRLALLAVSDAVRTDIRTALPAWPAGRIETLYNRLDTAAVQLIERKEARSVLGLPADVWVIANVGRLHPDKDQATLIRGFAQASTGLPQGSLLAIMGAGRLEASLKALAVELGVSERVRFLGQVPQARRYFSAFDLFVLTSDHEPFGMVLLEAMAAGLPILCTNCGGGSEVVQDEERLFELANVDELADLLVRFSRRDRDFCQIAQTQRERLCSAFSDDVARQRFWSLPIVREIS